MTRGSPSATGDPELFFVKKIVEAKVVALGTRRGQKKTWKFLTVWDGYDDLTWEPAESFLGSKYAVRLFWLNADCGHRNPDQMSKFKQGEIIKLKQASALPKGKGSPRKRKPGPSRSSVGLIGTRVFALWAEDKHYYSGVVQRRVGTSSTYVVRFDDDDEEVKVHLKHMRACNQIKPGDNAILKSDNVVVSNVRGDASFMVEKVADHTTVKISAYDIEEEWADRRLAHEDIVCQG
ncbi:hypothetical protein DFH06DRAFT_113158 [Mycena polygramma]|nr:hypothetical protein DFH06DRAFT_113158 [Mycena polygramma]